MARIRASASLSLAEPVPGAQVDFSDPRASNLSAANRLFSSGKARSLDWSYLLVQLFQGRH